MKFTLLLLLVPAMAYKPTVSKPVVSRRDMLSSVGAAAAVFGISGPASALSPLAKRKTRPDGWADGAPR